MIAGEPGQCGVLEAKLGKYFKRSNKLYNIFQAFYPTGFCSSNIKIRTREKEKKMLRIKIT